ncbi:bifunctional histidinol-phosphatase/imidazoleglycerol-phosphate dehydratase HisB [Eudoraea chungangensis]|uniref:bifunctional histidinol-phosphatase/imidazoleglycerol-phosphate dehydratase HisB n=1 Tax=Eudoraea chungangensis TaxID=1481905 RepID=UPI0023EE1620|nr:bifunctional histidinol-phosphatase/imidazoleglycerol-phosphate dehydratase HisB [Eudoraea chungangensis]
MKQQKKINKTKVLFIDRDGTLILEPEDEQIDSFDKVSFYPRVFSQLLKIVEELNFEIVMITNQDGLGTASFPENTFWPVHDFVIECFKNEGIIFSEVFIDKTFAHENADTRKPGTGLLKKYFTEDYDLENSFVIGDRLTDIELAINLGAKGIYINNTEDLGGEEVVTPNDVLQNAIALETNSWISIYEFLKLNDRQATISRITKETAIEIEIDLDGTGKAEISTGIAFFDHMLEQISKHGLIDLKVNVEGDLEVDEHHTIEDTAIALGEAFHTAIGDKLGVERYGFCLPMDDCLAQVALDFGGRNWLVWQAEFKREMIGQMPTEMFFHFFKSFSDGAKANLNIKAEGTNEHHKIEAIFKAFAKAIKMAVKRDPNKMFLPSTKGVL